MSDIGCIVSTWPALGDVRMAGHEVKPRSFMESNCNCSFFSDLHRLRLVKRQANQLQHGKGLSCGKAMEKWKRPLSLRRARVLMRLRAFSQVALCPSSVEETFGCVCRVAEGLPGS